MPILRIKNVGKGPRGCRPLRGPVDLEPGQEIEAEFSDAEAAQVKGNGEFVVVAVENAASGLGRFTAVLTLKDGPFLTFRAAAAKLLGPDAPTTKAEIVAALQAKAAA